MVDAGFSQVLGVVLVSCFAGGVESTPSAAPLICARRVTTIRQSPSRPMRWQARAKPRTLPAPLYEEFARKLTLPSSFDRRSHG